MTAYRLVTLTCDMCGEIHDSGSARTTAEARRIAKAEGWEHDSRGDTCPAHNGWRRTAFGWERV